MATWRRHIHADAAATRSTHSIDPVAQKNARDSLSATAREIFLSSDA